MYACMYVCMCVCVYILIHTQPPTCTTKLTMRTRTHIHAYVCIYIYTQVHEHNQLQAYTTKATLSLAASHGANSWKICVHSRKSSSRTPPWPRIQPTTSASPTSTSTISKPFCATPGASTGKMLDIYNNLYMKDIDIYTHIIDIDA